MRTRARNPFSTITTAGLLLPIDLLTRVSDGDPDLPGLAPKDYHLRSGERLHEAASRAWNECLAAWKSFRKKFAALPASDAGTTATRDEWLLPLFQELGYGRLQTKKAIDFDGMEYPVSHGWENHVPIHLLSARYPLDRRTPGVQGAATRSPYSLLQEMLNRSGQHRWGFVSNGLKLFLLRDNAALARAANVEFDLEAMFEGNVSTDFFLLYFLCHQSRLEILGASTDDKGTAGKPEDCWLERWANQADQQGTRAREKLRDGVEAAIKSLGAGFLTTKGNQPLREQLRSGELATQDYYRQLLRLVYRLLMLLVAEEKRTEAGHNLLHPIDTPADVRQRYARFYSVGRIRSLAYERRGTAHADLYESLKVLFLKLRTGYAPLGIPGMGSFLFSETATPDLDSAALANQDLLDAFRHLCYTEDTSGRGGSVRRPVDFGNLGSEELGSVYESLLELHPLIDTDAGPFTLGTAAGHERKTTGSYYTPTSLINCLLDSALDPVVTAAINVPDPKEAEKKLLELKVCDPACGSGHFLIAAAERMATHLARLRTGDDQPGTLDIQHAKRDIIGRCIYGVDLNPMAVELCKVSLWMEALEPGKPLSFLDHHIQQGNSLLGTTPRLLAEGIPDDAFIPIEGDDKEMCAKLKKDNKQERKDYAAGYRDFHFTYELGNLPAEFASLTGSTDDSVADSEAKAHRYAELVKGANYQNARLLADAWCAAFVWKKENTDLGRLCPTERIFRNLQAGPASNRPDVRQEIERLRQQYHFFHWHLAYPDVFRLPGGGENAENVQCGWNGGFDVVLGNPPWEKIQVEEQGFFASKSPAIAKLSGARRKKAIGQLASNDPTLFVEWTEHKRSVGGLDHLLKHTARYPFAGKGKINTYAIFVETSASLVNNAGRSSQIVPLGIITDHGTKDLFGHLALSGHLRSVYGFENEEFMFADVHHAFKFCLICSSGSVESGESMEFAFFARRVSELNEPDRKFILRPSDIELINPNTNNCPVFKYRRDFELTRHVYKSFPVIHNEVFTDQNSWQLSIHRVFNSTDDSNDMFTIPTDSFRLPRSLYEGRDVVAIYEGKMFHQFDHRFGTYVGQTESQKRQGKLPELDADDHANPSFYSQPRFWMNAELADRRQREHSGSRDWLIAFRDISSPVVLRTAISSVLPMCSTVDYRCLFFKSDVASEQASSFFAVFNSFVFDYIARQKFSGTHLSTFIVKQLPMPAPSVLAQQCVLGCAEANSRVLELTYTAWDLEPFAQDCGYDGPPFCWDEKRRFQLRCELDAAYFHLYLGPPDEWGADCPELREMFPTPRDAVDYIMETFPIVRRKDEAKYSGEYKTKTTILQMYDQMAEAIATGQTYQTWLDPPPGPPSDAAGNFIPFAQWDDAIRQRYKDVIHPPRTQRLDYGDVVADILLLLREWNSAVSILALEPAVLLMQNEQARRSFAGRLTSTPRAAGSESSYKVVEGIDIVYQGLVVNGAIEAVGQNGYRLLKPELVAELSAENQQRAREVVDAIKQLDRPEDAIAIVAEVTHERYAVAVP